jgi:hypothetical protein
VYLVTERDTLNATARQSLEAIGEQGDASRAFLNALPSSFGVCSATAAVTWTFSLPLSTGQASKQSEPLPPAGRAHQLSKWNNMACHVFTRDRLTRALRSSCQAR